MQHVDDVRAADRRRVVDAGAGESGMLAQLRGARIRQRAHLSLGAELQAAGRTRLDARRFEPLADAIRAQRALVDLFRLVVELRDVERASGDAVLTADAVLL